MILKLKEINAMIDRGGEHLAWLEDFIRHSDNRVVANHPDVHTLPESFDGITTNIRIRIGECANSFRNALNYMTCAIAEQDSGAIGDRVQFPIEDCRKVFLKRRNSQLEGIREERIVLFERFQPYNGGDWMKDLRELSNFYKHTGLILVNKQVDQIKPLSHARNIKARSALTGHMKTYRSLPFPITFPDGRPIIQTLDVVHARVSDVVDQFNPLLRDLIE